MKRIITIIALLTLGVFTSQAQTIQVKITVVDSGTTNSATLNLDGISSKDILLFNGVKEAWTKYKSDGGALSFDNWLKQDVKDRFQEYAKAKLIRDNADLAAKLTKLLTEQQDNLTVNDLNNLTTIASKAQ